METDAHHTRTWTPNDWPVFHWPQNPIKWKLFAVIFLSFRWMKNCTGKINVTDPLKRKLCETYERQSEKRKKEVSKLDQIKWTSNRHLWIALGYTIQICQSWAFAALSPFHERMYVDRFPSHCWKVVTQHIDWRKWSSFECMKSLRFSYHKRWFDASLAATVYYTINLSAIWWVYELWNDIAIKPNGLNWCPKRLAVSCVWQPAIFS